MINDQVSVVKSRRRAGRKVRKPTPSAPPLAATVQPRRTPQQSRSRARVTAILDAARTLIGTRGNDAVSMREIAAAAGAPISSVYQYFPDKNAILRELMASHLAAVRERVMRVFGGVRRREDLPGASAAALDGLIGLFSEEPFLATLWAGVQANTVLRELDAQDSREIAGYLSGVLRKLLPGVDRRDIEGVCLFAAHVPAGVVREALNLDPKSRQGLLRELKAVARLRMADLVARSR